MNTIENYFHHVITYKTSINKNPQIITSAKFPTHNKPDIYMPECTVYLDTQNQSLFTSVAKYQHNILSTIFLKNHLDRSNPKAGV